MGPKLSLAALLVLMPAAALSQFTIPGTLDIAMDDNTRVRAAFSARLTDGTRVCGPSKVVTGTWTPIINMYLRYGTRAERSRGNILRPGQAMTFSNGVLTLPHRGVWALGHSCRCDQQACDMYMEINGTPVSAAGTDLVERTENRVGAGWASKSVSTVEFVEANAQVQIRFDSGQSDDCLLETSFWYCHLWAWLIMNDDGAAQGLA